MTMTEERLCKVETVEYNFVQHQKKSMLTKQNKLFDTSFEIPEQNALKYVVKQEYLQNVSSKQIVHPIAKAYNTVHRVGCSDTVEAKTQ